MVGPIELELREHAPQKNQPIHTWLWNRCTNQTFVAMRDAAGAVYEDMGMYEPLHVAYRDQRLPEVVSEAIQAAEALGL